MVTWRLKSYADECALSDKDAEFHAAFQREDGETERSFYKRVMDLHALCRYIHSRIYVRSRFLQGLWWQARFGARNLVAEHRTAAIENVVNAGQRAKDHQLRLSAACFEQQA